MKRLLSLLSAVAVSLSALAQVTIPFDVPTPTWEGLVTSKTESGPRVFKKPNASSDNLVEIEAGEEINYRWESPSMYLGDTESRFTIKSGMQIPYISVAGAWAEVEIHGDNGDFKGWSVASNLASLKLKDITAQDLVNCDRAIAWPQEDGIYVIVVAGGYYGWTDFCIGKLKDGYVICPYSCTIEWGDTNHSGILNGKLGAEGEDLSKFTLKDVEYILSQAKEFAEPMFAGYGFLNDSGEKEIGWIWTTLVGTSTPADDNQIYNKVEQEPTYPGGLATLLKNLAQNIRYPMIAAENNIQGNVVVRFIVEKDGSITNPEVIKKVDPDLDREALRVVRKLGKMSSPGKINGRAVRSYYSVPVNFKL